jgi:copper chaperone CopZ
MQRYGAALAGGLLASSCCVVQLVLNIFSIGCAGFNTILGPYRWFFLLFALGGLGYSFYTDVLAPCQPEAKKKGKGGRACVEEVKRAKKIRFAITAAIVLLLSFSPELLAAVNARPDLLLAPIQRHVFASTDSNADSTNQACSYQQGTTRIFVHVDGLHCAACENRAINALLRLDRCARVNLAYGTGQGDITVPTHHAAALTDQRIEQAIADVAFTARVLRRETITSTPSTVATPVP